MDAEMQEALRDLPTLDFAAGDVIIAESKPARSLFFLKSGVVDVFKGPTRVATESMPGAVFGEMSLLLESSSTATVCARQDSSFYFAEDGAAFLHAHPQVALNIARLLATRLESITRYVANVKEQCRQGSAHLDMVDDVVETLMAKQPRRIERKGRGH